MNRVTHIGYNRTESDLYINIIREGDDTGEGARGYKNPTLSSVYRLKSLIRRGVVKFEYDGLFILGKNFTYLWFYVPEPVYAPLPQWTEDQFFEMLTDDEGETE